MRMSCNGCRVLRKGCSENCSIRPCLKWISDPEAQGNATVFLAKFYGRAGLMNLINEGPENLRHEIFRSLLYEACGRIVNPIYGSVGLLWSGNWHRCQAAVDAVLKGAPIAQISSDSATSVPVPPFIKSSTLDIRHVAKDNHDLLKVNKSNKPSFKRSANLAKSHRHGEGLARAENPLPDPLPADARRMWSEEPITSQTSRSGEAAASPSGEHESALSGQTSMATTHSLENNKAEEGEVELELTLGFEPPHHYSPRSSSSSSISSHNPRRSTDRPTAAAAAAIAAPERSSDRAGVDLDLHLPL